MLAGPADSPRFPGLRALDDGAGAVVRVETLASQGACAYPITPSTPMGVGFEAQVAAGARNAWGEALAFLEPESEHSSASACEGFALGGGRVSNFTSGQGLVLMKEVLYVVAGKRLPMVFHVAARALTWHALNIHAGHDDIFAVADCGWGILFARSPQEAADLALVARAAAEETGTPFFVAQDGFITSHTLETLRLPEPELVREFLGRAEDRMPTLVTPARPLQSGTVQNQDAYMRGRIAHRAPARRVASALRDAMDRYAGLTGRRYTPVTAYRTDDARAILVTLGSTARTAEVACDRARARGLPVGVVHLTALRPFPGAELASILWRAQVVGVVERLDAPLGQSNPLAVEVKAALADGATLRDGYAGAGALPIVHEGVAGLGGREVTVGDLEAAFEHLARDPHGHRSFVLGVRSEESLEAWPEPEPEGFVLRGHSVGGLGSVTTNKLLASILWRLLGSDLRAWPYYGSEKRGMPTTYFLIVAPAPVRSQCEPRACDFVAVHTPLAFEWSDPLAGLRPGGCLYVQAPVAGPDALWALLPAHVRAEAARRRLRVAGLDAERLAREIAPRPELAQRVQGVALAGVFLRTAPLCEALRARPDTLWPAVESAVAAQFEKRGGAVVEANLRVVRRAFDEVIVLHAETRAATGAEMS